MDRRRFLGGALTLGCSAAAFPLATPVALASAPWETRLVVIVLRGAMDGLDVIQPLGDPEFAALRPTIRAEATPLDNGYWGLHPALAPLMPLWRAGEMGFAHALSTPYRAGRSHFDGQDLLEAGTAGLDGLPEEGWLNRMLQGIPGATVETAYAVGRDRLLILSGEARISRWSPETRLRLSPATRDLVAFVHGVDPLFGPASRDALAILDQLAEEGGDEGFRADHKGLAGFAASRLRRETRIASFSLGGWDTHANQGRALTGAATRLAEAIVALRDGLGPVWEKTAVLCMTEFGRTARQNGTLGTDHGTGGAMLYAGGALRGGQVITDWPGLGPSDLLDGRDLMPTRDVRAFAGWAMRGLFGLSRSEIEGRVFPGLELGADPGFVG